ncbi:MAG: UDP-glucose/GDP-mannose dehydrogenase family protein [FCB group bacterium]|nr:UDP-glucose/GDP-mannose dehydrogenase family protein [FCB group bacterium]
MTITIIGHGYVGLVTSCVFADFGNKVWVIGHSPDKIARLKKGDPIIYEPGLKELLIKNLEAKRIHFTLDYDPAIKESTIVFIAVGTPPRENGQADLSAVLSVAKKIGQNLANHYTVISCKSTVSIGTNNKVKKIIDQNKHSKAKVEVASCPEFLREGTALADTTYPDRIVIGSDSRKAIDKLLELHQPLGGKRVITDLASAELIKYTANAMLATKISFANLISFYCQKTGADVEAVLDAVGMDKRIGRIFMNPGLGYGGSCLPKDVKAIVYTGKSLGIKNNFLKDVDDLNYQAQENFVNQIIENCPGKNVGLWGLSFKPNTDDIRFAPSLTVINTLLKKGYQITAYDPEATANMKKIVGDKISYAASAQEAIRGKDALIVVTEWNEFKQVDLDEMKHLLKRAVIFDGRNIYEPEKMKELTFKYFSIGRKPVL